MLTVEKLKENEALKGLGDEQLRAIEVLSATDETEVIGKKVGEIHTQYDNDIKAITGLDKPQGVKTYDHLKTVLGNYKTQSESNAALNAKITSLEGDIANYKELIKDGKGNEALNKELKDAQDKLKLLQTTYESDKDAWTKEKSEFSKKQDDLMFNYEFNTSISGLKFKKEYPASVQDVLKENAKNKILVEYTPEWVTTGTSKKLVFRDSNGAIVLNPENKLEPYTLAELAAKTLKDTLDNTKEGTGTKPINKDVPLDISSAKTQIEAHEIISKMVLAEGILKTDPSFATRLKELSSLYGVDKLKIR